MRPCAHAGRLLPWKRHFELLVAGFRRIISLGIGEDQLGITKSRCCHSIVDARFKQGAFAAVAGFDDAVYVQRAVFIQRNEAAGRSVMADDNLRGGFLRAIRQDQHPWYVYLFRKDKEQYARRSS